MCLRPPNRKTTPTAPWLNRFVGPRQPLRFEDQRSAADSRYDVPEDWIDGAPNQAIVVVSSRNYNGQIEFRDNVQSLAAQAHRSAPGERLSLPIDRARPELVSILQLSLIHISEPTRRTPIS